MTGRFVRSLALLVGVLGASVLPAGSTLDPQTVARIDALVEHDMEQGVAPGVSIAIARGGRLLYARGYGEADLAQHTAATASTAYAIGSVTKQFTATAILLLQQEHRLSIDHRLSKYVPELRGAGRITLRELLQQRSGVPDYTRIPGLDPIKGMGWSAFIDAVNRLPEEFAPGSAFRYNNLNYLLLGRVVERVAGMPYERFVRERIIWPLHLESTGFLGDGAARATGYARAANGFVPAPIWDASLLGGAGSMTSSALDLVRWDAALQSGELLGPGALMLLEQGASENGYAMGWVSERAGDERLLWHNGEIAGFHAMNAMLASQHLFVAVLVNGDAAPQAVPPERLARQLIGVLAPASALGEEATAQQQGVPADPVLASRVGRWIAQLAAGAIDRTELTPEMNAALTPDLVAKTAAAWGPLGKPTGIEVLGHQGRGDLDSYVLRVEFAQGPFIWKIVVTRDGRLAGAGGLEPQ
ncbi:MAG: beta-lactamase family protein [bacterium]|nr:beta-lactamase family protein [bacterium]